MNRLNNFLRAILSIAMMLVIGFPSFADYDFKVDGICYYYIDKDAKTVEVTVPDFDYKNDVTIPATVTHNDITYSVTRIGFRAFKYCTKLTSVTIPNSVTEIGIEAFSDCTGLTSIVIPNSVTSIGYSAFYHCINLTSATIGNSLRAISDGAFEECYSLKSVTIPNSVTLIYDGAFYRCSSLESVTIPNSVTDIGNEAFRDCTSLTSVTIGNSVKRIDHGVFMNCSSLKTVSIGDSVDRICWDAFYNCSSLESVTIPNSVSLIESNAFYKCSSLTSVSIGNSVTDIYSHAFYRCSSLESVTIPNSVTDIGNEAFRDCTSLTSVTIGNSVKYIRSYAFSGTNLTSIKSLNTTPPTCGDGTFSNCYNAILEVPAEAKEAYSKANVWKNFSNIIEFATVKVSIQEKKATFYIPTTENAETYTVNVYSDEAMTQLVDYTIYDVTGKILPMATTLEMSIDGLEYGLYYYDVIAKSKKGETLKNYTGTFDIGLTGIENISSENENFEVARYDIYGRLLTEPTKGINIIKMSDGSTRKVIVK